MPPSPCWSSEAVPRWISEQEFGELVGINFAFPGISILKLAGMVGLRAAGTPGLLVAIVGITLPGLVLTIAAYSLLVQYRDYGLVRRGLMTMQYAAAALLASSALRIMHSASGGQFHVVGAALVLVVLGRNNPSLYTVNGRPLYVHLNGLAIILLK